VLATAATIVAQAGVQPAQAEPGSMPPFEFDATSESSVSVSSAGGERWAEAVYSGGGANGYARGQFEVAWRAGETVTYSGAFYLPSGFTSAIQGQVALMRWDNWPTYQDSGDVGGIVIQHFDKRAWLVRGRYGGEQVALVGPMALPEGRWFTLTVTQRLSTASPYSQVSLDGELVGASIAQNFYGRAVDRVRFGLVAITAGAQTNPLSLRFDEVWVSGWP
jgi:hypothetical protein